MSKWFWVIVVLATSFLLRLINLTHLPVFVDEAIYIRWSQIMANVPTLRFLPLTDGKQPLYMWVLMLVVKYFSDPLFIGRLVSVVSGLATTGGVFVLSYILFKSRAASFVAAFVWALSPFAVFFDRTALVDSMLAAISVWTIVFTVFMVKTAKIKFSLFTGFFLGLALLTKSPALFLFILLPVVWLLAQRPIRLTRLVVLTGVSGAIAFGM